MSFLPAPSSLPGSPQPPSYLPAAAELEAAGDDMAPTLRSSPTSASARRRKTAAELLTAEEDAAASRERAERTKRGCWTCRIRRKSEWWCLIVDHYFSPDCNAPPTRDRGAGVRPITIRLTADVYIYFPQNATKSRRKNGARPVVD